MAGSGDVTTRKAVESVPHADRPGAGRVTAGLDEVAEQARHSRGLVLFLRSIAWSHDLFQRPHQLAMAFARHGWVAVFEDAGSGEDDVAEIEANLFVTRAPLQELRALPVTLLWTFTYNYDQRDRFPAEIPCVYDWIDDLSVFHHDPALLAKNHLRALEEATVVAVVARRLLDEARAVRPDALYLPNGVDVEHFVPTGRRPDDPVADELLASGRPIAGYYGALADWFDFQLLHDTAILRPDWSFLLIGPQYAGADAVRDQPALALPNVRWIGPRPYRELPAWLELFDVATIPFRINDITRATSPLKLFEYFAGGKSVITTPMPECAVYPEVRIVSDADGFAAALDPCRELATAPAHRRRLHAVALENSWSFRIAQVVAQLTEAEASGGARGARPAAAGPADPGLIRELTTQRARANALEADLEAARGDVSAAAERIGRLRAEAESTRETAGVAVAAANQTARRALASEQDAAQHAEVLRGEIARLTEAAHHAETQAADLREKLEATRTELEAARADAAAWREEAHRGPVARFMRRHFPPRPEGRLTYWRRALYYAVARRILGLWRRAGQHGRGMATWYEYRFLRDRRRREEAAGFSLEAMRCPTEPDLVSIVLPVFNGEGLVEEAIESVLAQTRERFELILVDDGSTDETPGILDDYAERDPRVRVIHQPNQKLPRALSNGIRAAHGELLTWTSDDNRLKPEFLARLVDCLGRNPTWDMVWANVDIIGDDGRFLEGSEWYYGYQRPPGSPHIHFPTDPSELNVWPNNYVGAAFLYRDRVAWLLGDYCPDRFTVEDYDYWMQVNELLTVRHADFDDPVYDYRFHDRSLTSHEKELRILELRERLMVFDDFRRDFALSPLIWMLGPVPKTEPARALHAAVRERALALGHTVAEPGDWPTEALPRLWMPTVYVEVTDCGAASGPDRSALPPNTVAVLLTPSGEELSAEPGDWDLCAAVHPGPALIRTRRAWQGWLGFGDVPTCCRALDIAVRARHLKAIEAEISSPRTPAVDATVVVCTYRRSASLSATLQSVGRQSLPPSKYEVVVVNNDPDERIDDLVDALRTQSFAEHPDHVRLVLCPLKGLSHARNAGIAEARGAVVCFVDDDAVAERQWLAGILAAYESDDGVGVVGGRILLRVPEPPPQWLDRTGWSYWSHHDPGYTEPTEVDEWWEYPWGANWSARRELLVAMGGFRSGYGRRGYDFGGGEEVVAASLARRLGARVVVTPAAVVRHHVDPSRFTRRDLRATVRAGTFVNYFIQRDLYVPTWLGPGYLLEQIGKRLLRLAWPWGRSRFQRLEARYFLRAELELLGTMWRDWRARARREG